MVKCTSILLMVIHHCLQMHTAVDDIDGLDDVENSILYYNQAVIHYHMRQYSEAISIVEKLYQFLEPFGTFENAHESCYSTALIRIKERIVSRSGALVWHGLMVFSVLEEKFAQAVCFLLVDLYLLTFQPEKALHLLAMLEKVTVKEGNNKNGKGEVMKIYFLFY